MPPRATFRFRSRDHNEMLRKFLRSCQPLPLGLLLIFIAWSAMKEFSRHADSKTLELTQGLEEDWAETVSVMVDLELKSFVSSTSQRYQVDFESSDSLKARNSQ